MKIQQPSFRRLRTILDGALVILILLLAVASSKPVDARPEQEATSRQWTNAAPIEPEHSAGAGGRASQHLSPLDNATLAGMIAAENAALTLPQHLVNLPVIVR